MVFYPSDASLRDLVDRILPLATYYTAISSFVESRSLLDFGLVNHAVVQLYEICSKYVVSFTNLAMELTFRSQDYQTLLSQLEYFTVLLTAEILVLHLSDYAYTTPHLSTHS